MGADESSRAQQDALEATKVNSGTGRTNVHDAIARYLGSVHYSALQAAAKEAGQHAGRRRNDES